MSLEAARKDASGLCFRDLEFFAVSGDNETVASSGIDNRRNPVRLVNRQFGPPKAALSDQTEESCNSVVMHAP